MRGDRPLQQRVSLEEYPLTALVMGRIASKGGISKTKAHPQDSMEATGNRGKVLLASR